MPTRFCDEGGLTGTDLKEREPGLPRRVFMAAGLAAIAAGGAAALGVLGQLTAPQAESFRFARGTGFASGEEARLRGFLADAAQDDRISVIITGHSGTSGDATANLELSTERAELAEALAREMGVDASRIRAAGAGGGNPLPQEAGESDRAWQSRLARVEVSLQVRQ